MSESIYQRVSAEVKIAMKAREKDRLAALRLVMAEFKSVEVDERIELDDTRILVIFDKMTKQRRDSFRQYQDAGRQDLAGREAMEIAIIEEFLPERMSAAELGELINSAIADTGAAGMQDMGKVMSVLKPQVQGRAEMGKVSALVKTRLAN